jgi:hypothetical protein
MTQGISKGGSTLFGNDVLFQVLQLLANPAELQLRLNMLAEAEQKADVKISSIGPADEIIRMRDDLRVELDEAKKARAMALDENARIIGEAKAEAVSIRQSLSTEQESARAKADSQLLAADSKLVAALEFEAKLDMRKAKLEDDVAALEAQRAALDKEREDVAAARADNSVERDRLAKISARLAEDLQ